MIKVNLLRNLGGAATAGAGAAMQGTGVIAAPSFGSSNEVNKQAGMRLALIAGVVGLVMFYEHTELSEKREKLSQAQSKLAEVQARLQGYGEAGKIVSDYNNQKNILASQVKVLEGLTINRLREVKLLDALQSALPQKAWIDHLKDDNGKIELKGYAPDAETVNTILRQFESNVLFTDVQPKENVEVDLPEFGKVRSFVFTFIAGKPVATQ